VDFTVQENAPALGRVTLTKIQGGRLPPAAKVFFCMNLNYPRSRRDIEPGVRVPSRLFYGDDPATSTYPGYLYNHVMQFAPTPQPDGFGRWRDVSDSVGVVGDGPRTAWKCIYDEAKDKLVHVWSGPNAPPSGVQAFNCTTATWEASTEFGNADDYRAPGRRALVLGHSHPGYDPVNRGVYYLESYAGPNGRCRLWRLNLENNAWVKPAYTLTYLGLAPGTIQQTPLPNEFMLACWDTTNHVFLWWNYHDTSTPASELFAYTPAAPPADSGTWSADLGTVVTQANDLCGGLSHPAVAAGFKVWGRTMLYDPRQNCVWFGGDTIGLAHERNHFFPSDMVTGPRRGRTSPWDSGTGTRA